MKKILFVTAFVPGRTGAGENFSRQFINEISARNKVDLIYFKYQADANYVSESGNVNVLRVFRNSFKIKFFNFLMFPVIFPLFSVRFNIKRLHFIKKTVKKNNYDLVIFDFSQTFLFSNFISGVPVLLNCHDVIAQRYSRIYSGIFEPIVKLSEKFVLNNKNAQIFCLSEKDRVLLSDFYNLQAISTSIFLDKSVINSYPRQAGQYFVFFANWNRPDNSEGLKWFLNNVYPGLAEHLKFKIIGSGLDPSVVSRIVSCPGIEYMGFISNPYPVISDAMALISPLFTGAGIKVKVLESLACGTPVIGTKISMEGVSDEYSRYLFPADDAVEFIQKVNNFSVDLEEKKGLKKLFLSSYRNNNISDWVNREN